MNSKNKLNVPEFIRDLNFLAKLPVSKKYQSICVSEFPFDAQLLHASSLYRHSRVSYLKQGGTHNSRVSSMMRSLSAQDLFKDEIDFTPLMSELMWFKDHSAEVADPKAQVAALKYFNENSLYHEQNHRVIWKLLPPAPKGKEDIRRYLNFAESLVVALDLALGDQLGKKNSEAFERLGIVFRPAGNDNYHTKSKSIYRQYLLALIGTTYFALELIDPKDILKAVNYVLPGQHTINKVAVKRGLELSQLFTLNTNPQWQNLNWKEAETKLARINKNRKDEAFIIAADPLDLNFEFAVARSILDFYGM